MAARKHRFLWVTDPWETLDHARDTTLRLAHEAANLGFESDWCDVRSIRLEGNAVLLNAAPIMKKQGDISKHPFPSRVAKPTDFSSVHYRVDPPVDLAYLQPLQLLLLAKAQVVNSVAVLMTHNEKLEAAFLKGLMPETLASSQWEILLRFGKEQQKTVLKPMHLAQSKGVHLLQWNSIQEQEKNRLIISEATEIFSRPVVLQKYLAGISEGEQRIWFLDGTVLACVRKLPVQGDFRVNIDQGSVIKKSKLSRAEKKAAEQIGKFLRSQRIRLAAVDLIDGLVTDFNFTSPGLITTMEETLGTNLARPIIQALAKARR